MSLILLYGESTLFFTENISVIYLGISYIHDETQVQLFCLAPLLYIVICTYVPLFQLKLKGRYGLYKNNHTDPANLIWSACFMARLIPALSYNFTLLARVEKTKFREVIKISDLMEDIQGYFSIFFPLILIIFCLLNGFNIYGRMMNAIGLSQLTFTEMLDYSRIEEGKSLIAKARFEREKRFKEDKKYSVKIIKSQSFRSDAQEIKVSFKGKEPESARIAGSASIRSETEETKYLRKPLRNS